MPRATRAAWLALPPSLVRMPRAASKPATSSASVKGLTNTTSRPPWRASTAAEAVNTIAPLAAPGEAATPRTRTSKSASGPKVGCSSASSEVGSTVSSASSRVEQPLLDGVDREAHRCLGRALGVAGLEHVEAALLHRELGVLHVAVVALEVAEDLHQLAVGLGHRLPHLREVVRGAHS